jgi:excisionase family DNA binding protein
MTQHDTNRDANMTHQDNNMTTPVMRVTVEEAAKLLAVSVDAIRKRIERGTLQSEKIDGTRFVFVNTEVMTHQDRAMTIHQDSDMSDLVASMQDQIDTLKQELDDWKEEARRKDAILLTMAQRIPELEPARDGSPEAPGASQTPSENGGSSTEPDDDNGQHRRSWWRRLFEV